MESIAGDWFDFNGLLGAVELYGVEETRIENSTTGEEKIYHHLKNKLIVTEDDFPEATDKKSVADRDAQIMKLSFEGKVCKAFYFYEKAKTALLNGDIKTVVQASFILGNLAAAYDLMNFQMEVLSLDNGTPPHIVLSKMKNLGKVTKDGAFASKERNRPIRELYKSAINTAGILWSSDEFIGFTHKEMANYLLEEYSESKNGELTFLDLAPTSLRDKIKDYLKEKNETWRIQSHKDYDRERIDLLKKGT
ncbi:MAG: hypothetical protein JRG71_13275 [Deltaproteobacteria bacterium]|nr:hypothetical protein [Deltaproteobacteria bacterium]